MDCNLTSHDRVAHVAYSTEKRDIEIINVYDNAEGVTAERCGASKLKVSSRIHICEIRLVGSLQSLRE